MTEIRSCPKFYDYSGNLQVWKSCDKIRRRYVPDKVIYGLFRAQGQATLKINCTIWPKYELVREFLPVLDIFEFEEVAIRTEDATARITFPHYKSMESLCCHGNHSSKQIYSKTIYSQCSTPALLQINLIKTGLGDIHAWIVDGRTTKPCYTISSSGGKIKKFWFWMSKSRQRTLCLLCFILLLVWCWHIFLLTGYANWYFITKNSPSVTGRVSSAHFLCLILEIFATGRCLLNTYRWLLTKCNFMI